MGFGGGGSNVTKAHTHDSTIVQDGGSLAANVTQFGLSAGSVLYSDGSNIQELAVGSASDVLTVNGPATAPAWVTPSTPAASGWSSIYSATGLTGLDFQSADMLNFRYFDIMMYFGTGVEEPLQFEFYDSDGVLYPTGRYGSAGWFRDVYTSDSNVNQLNASFGNNLGAAAETGLAYQCHLRINSYAYQSDPSNYALDVAIEINQRYTGASYPPLACIGNGWAVPSSTTAVEKQQISGIKLVSPTSAQINGIVDIYGLGTA